MKKTLSAGAGVLFCFGLAILTGVDENPIQAVYGLVALASASIIFSYINDEK